MVNETVAGDTAPGPVDSDVIVVGAGPVGLTLALYLVRAGRRVTVLEQGDEPQDSPRAMVYLHPLLKDLDGIGMLEPMLSVGWLDREGFNLHLPQLGEIISIPNTALEDVDPHPYNVHLGQDQYSRLALTELAQYPGAEVRFGVEVVDVSDDDDGASVRTVEGEVLRAAWVVGADGGHSAVRRSMGATLEGTTWPERFVATNVRFDFRALGYRSSNMIVHDEIGCIVAQITPDGLWRCTFQESDDLPLEGIEGRIATHFERLLGDDAKRVEVVSYRPYRMHQRLATTLRAGHVVLAGDAAHLTNPTGGLGLTTGLYDVILLQEALLAVLDGADQGVLDDYAEERARVFREISSPNATQFKRLVYDSTDLDALDRGVQPFRDAAASLEGQRAFLGGLDMVRSPRLETAR